MNEVYVVWYEFETPEPDPKSPGLCKLVGIGELYSDEEEALVHCRTLVYKDGHERVMVIKLRPWSEPELLLLAGEFTGSEALDWYHTSNAIKTSLAHALDWAVGKFELNAKQEVNF